MNCSTEVLFRFLKVFFEISLLHYLLETVLASKIKSASNPNLTKKKNTQLTSTLAEWDFDNIILLTLAGGLNEDELVLMCQILTFLLKFDLIWPEWQLLLLNLPKTFYVSYEKPVCDHPFFQTQNLEPKSGFLATTSYEWLNGEHLNRCENLGFPDYVWYSVNTRG